MGLQVKTKSPMAALEIDSPVSSAEGTSDKARTRASKDAPVRAAKDAACNSEKEPSTTVSLDSPITYHYLAFENELPAPLTIGPAIDGSPAPELPDLRQLVSPFTWAESRKTFILWLSCAVTVVTAFSAGSYSPATQQMSEYWHVSQVAIYVGITTFTTGFAIAPMILAPFSELNGRKPVFVATGILFVVSQLCCAVTRSFPGMLVARFFVGVGGSTFSTMVGGVVSDMYHKQGRSAFEIFTAHS